CACLLVLVFASTSGAAARVGIGKMTVVPNRLTAGTTENELSFSFTADSAPLTGTTLFDVPRGWSKPQQTDPSAPGYVELQALGCVGTSITAISSRRIAIATKCPPRPRIHLLSHTH